PGAAGRLGEWPGPPGRGVGVQADARAHPRQPSPGGRAGGGARGVVPPGASRAGSAVPAPLSAASVPLPDPPVWRLDGSTATAAEVFADTYTDALVVLHDGQLVAERYAAGMTAATPHLLMS